MSTPNQNNTSHSTPDTPARKGRKILLTATIGLALIGGGLYSAMKSGVMAQVLGHNTTTTHGHGADGTGHDIVTMPGLRGKDATNEESAELAVMFRQFDSITREVTNLDNGIRTVTYSADEELMNTVVAHVVGMINRVEEGRDPQIIIQSPTLDILFERRDRIKTDIETTDEGIVVIQTSDDPEVVTALQTHAAEVSGMVDRGMDFVHDAMANRVSN